MNQIEINNPAKRALEEIINELFIIKLDSKLNEKLVRMDKKTDDDRKIITRKINDFKEDFERKSKDLPNSIKRVTSEIRNHSEGVKEVTKNGIESIQNKLSEIQNENLAEIQSKAISIVENQKNFSEGFLLKLDSVVKSHTRSIVSNNLETQELVKRSQAELKSDIVALINNNGCDQKKNIQDLCKNISDFVELENQNNSNLQKQFATEFQKVERLSSALIRDLEEKLEFSKLENEKQFSEVIRRSNLGFISLLVINVLILIFLLLSEFLVIN